MPQSLENVTVGDDYTDATTAMFAVTTFKVSAIVANQAVYFQLLEVPQNPGNLRAEAGAWKTPEEFQVPGTGDITRPFLIGGIRFRNATPSQPDAQVTARAT